MVYIRWTLIGAFQMAWHVEYPWAKIWSETDGTHFFSSNYWEVQLHSGGVGKHGLEAVSEQLQIIETTLEQCPSLHKACTDVGAPAQQLFELSLTVHHTLKVVMVFFNLIDLLCHPTGLLKSNVMGANNLAQIFSSNHGKATRQNRWQCIRGYLVVGVPGSDNSQNAYVKTSKEIGNAPRDIHSDIGWNFLLSTNHKHPLVSNKSGCISKCRR